MVLKNNKINNKVVIPNMTIKKTLMIIFIIQEKGDLINLKIELILLEKFIAF